MSSLEERREARRRRRMQEEAETDENEANPKLTIDRRMMHARREKENRLSRLAAEVNSFNEEDDYERKRRERREAREARLRSAATEEETTPRRSRRGADEDEAPAEETRRSRRRRGDDEEEEAARQAAEEERRRQEAEEQRKRDEEERERREAEEALQRIEDEKRAAEEAEQRRIEDEKRAAEEAERKKREAEERRKRIYDDPCHPPCEKNQSEFPIQSSHPYYNGNSLEDEDSVDTENDADDEQVKSDTSMEARSSPWFSDNKDGETESRSYLSSSREDIYDLHTDEGSLGDSTDNDRCSLSAPIAHENDSVDYEHSVKEGEIYYKRSSSLPDSDKHNFVKTYASHYEIDSSSKEVQLQPDKKLDIPVKNYIPYRGSNLKDIQKKFEAECNPPTCEPVKRNKNEINGKGFISSKISTVPVINGLSDKDSNSKSEKFKEVHIQFELAGKTNTSGTHIKNLSIHNATSLPDKQMLITNTRLSEQNINNCSKWPPERGRSVRDLSEKFLISATNDRNSFSQEKPPVVMKSVVKRWPCAQKAEISKTKTSESLSNDSSSLCVSQTNSNKSEIKRDVLSRWPPASDPKQTARESIASAIALKLNSTDLAGISISTTGTTTTTPKSTNPVSATSTVVTATPVSSRWPPSNDKEIKPSTASTLENRKLRQKTCEPILPVKHSSSGSESDSLSPSQMHALKSPTFPNSFDPNTNHLTKDGTNTDNHHSLTSKHSLNETQFKLNNFHEEEEREEAERKKRQEEPPPESLPVGEKSLQLNQVPPHLGLNDEVDEEIRKRQVLSERIIPLPDNLEELSKAQMQDLVKKLHGKMAELEEEVYDWEFKLRRQEFEINDLTLKVNDTRGKFVKPVLRKISKTEAKLAKLERTKKDDFRTTLKSSGHKHDKIDEEDAQAAEAEA